MSHGPVGLVWLADVGVVNSFVLRLCLFCKNKMGVASMQLSHSDKLDALDLLARWHKSQGGLGSDLASRVRAGPRLAHQLLLEAGNAGQQGVGLGCPPLIHLLHTLLPRLCIQATIQPFQFEA